MADPVMRANAAWMRQRYQARRTQGLCGCCGQHPPAGYRTCDAYRAKVARSKRKGGLS